MGGLEGAEDDVFVGNSEVHVCGATAAPTTGNGDEDFGELFDKGGLLFRVDHDVAVAEFGGGERGKDAAADAEVGGAHVGAFFGAGEGEGYAAEIVDVHGWASSGILARVWGAKRGRYGLGEVRMTDAAGKNRSRRVQARASCGAAVLRPQMSVPRHDERGDGDYVSFLLASFGFGCSRLGAVIIKGAH